MAECTAHTGRTIDDARDVIKKLWQDRELEIRWIGDENYGLCPKGPREVRRSNPTPICPPSLFTCLAIAKPCRQARPQHGRGGADNRVANPWVSAWGPLLKKF
jgi:hypothetical protein